MTMQQAEEIEEQREKMVGEKQKLETVRKQREGIVFDEQELAESRREQLQFRSREIEAVQKARGCQQIAETLEKNLQQLEGIQQQLLELKNHNQQLEKTLEKTVLFTNSLQSVQAVLRESMLEAINEALQSIWPKVYPYADFDNCRLCIQEGDYEIMVKNRSNEWIRVEGNLSGGERSAVALCVRMAFSLVLTQNLGWLILDEPTHNLDGLTVQELASLLKNQLPELVEQTFVITHDKQMEAAASGALYEIVRDKNTDGASFPQKKELY
jgi:exonuclease SbcC